MSFPKLIFFWCVIVLMASSASVLTRFCDIPATDIGFWRVFGAGLSLAPFALARTRRQSPSRIFSPGTILTGSFLGVHFATWCWAIQNCSIANATLFIGLQPLMVPFIAHWIVGERINRWEAIGVLLAIAGTIWLGLRQFNTDINEFNGSAVAVISALFCATYIVLGRRFRRGQDAVAFGTGVFLVAAAVQAAASFAMHGGISVGSGRTVAALAGLVLLPTIGGHALMLFLLKYARPQLISFTIPAQFILATIAAVPIFGEIPPMWFYPGAATVLIGVAIGVAKAEV